VPRHHLREAATPCRRLREAAVPRCRPRQVAAPRRRRVILSRRRLCRVVQRGTCFTAPSGVPKIPSFQTTAATVRATRRRTACSKVTVKYARGAPGGGGGCARQGHRRNGEGRHGWCGATRARRTALRRGCRWRRRRRQDAQRRRAAAAHPSISTAVFVHFGVVRGIF
jgi:hypothetical protein